MTEVVTVFYLVAWFGSYPIMSADGNVAQSRGQATVVGEYDTRARCELDRKIIAASNEAMCVAREKAVNRER